LPSLPRKISTAASIITIASAVGILFFQVISPAPAWRPYLFGAGLLSYGLGCIAFGLLTHKLYSPQRAIITMFGFAITIVAVIIAFQTVPIPWNPAVYFTCAYFVSIALIIMGIGGIFSAVINVVSAKKKPPQSSI
jgi:membrane-bound ClpP family serine protease